MLVAHVSRGVSADCMLYDGVKYQLWMAGWLPLLRDVGEWSHDNRPCGGMSDCIPERGLVRVGGQILKTTWMNLVRVLHARHTRARKTVGNDRAPRCIYLLPQGKKLLTASKVRSSASCRLSLHNPVESTPRNNYHLHLVPVVRLSSVCVDIDPSTERAGGLHTPYIAHNLAYKYSVEVPASTVHIWTTVEIGASQCSRQKQTRLGARPSRAKREHNTSLIISRIEVF